MKPKTLDDYGRGRWSAIREITAFVEKEISALKQVNPAPNSPRQITNGGKLLAYNKIMCKLKSSKQKTEKHSIS